MKERALLAANQSDGSYRKARVKSSNTTADVTQPHFSSARKHKDKHCLATFPTNSCWHLVIQIASGDLL